jgi:hypothetical protein
MPPFIAEIVLINIQMQLQMETNWVLKSYFYLQNLFANDYAQQIPGYMTRNYREWSATVNKIAITWPITNTDMWFIRHGFGQNYFVICKNWVRNMALLMDSLLQQFWLQLQAKQFFFSLFGDDYND